MRMMALLSAFVQLALISGSLALSSPHSEEKKSTSSLLSLQVVHSTNQDVFGDVWLKRAVTSVPLANHTDVAYFAKLGLGTPQQSVWVQIDTGSFELWVDPDCSNLGGGSNARFCQSTGSYDPSSSSTSTALTSTKSLKYGIGSANIDYVTDTIALLPTSSTLTGVQFGVAQSTTEMFSGILGIGAGINSTIRYRNLVDELANQGVTKTKAFSLALGSKDEQEGVLVFGGVDTGKYAGKLQTLPILPAASSPDGVPRYWVEMNFMSLTPPSGKTKQYANTSMPVFLDSGTTMTLLPTVIADAIAVDFGVTGGADANGFYYVDCSLNNLPGTMNFAFNGVTIQVPYNELIREVQTTAGLLCILGISANEQFPLLGDTFLRSAYAVFDQTNNAIHMAQYVNCATNEVEITKTTNLTGLAGQCNAPVFGQASSSTTSSSVPSSTSKSLPTVTVTAGASSPQQTQSNAATGISPPGLLMAVAAILLVAATQ